jgi:hypothetical protein
LVWSQCIEDLLLNIYESCVIINGKCEFLGLVNKTSWEILDTDISLLLGLGYRQTKHVERIKGDRYFTAFKALDSGF